jgi:hypothetical protein
MPLPHGGPISWGFEGWNSVRDGQPPKGNWGEYLVCATDGLRSTSKRGDDEEWKDNRGITIMAWARIPMIDWEAFLKDFNERA